MQFIHLYLSINVKNPEAESLFHYYLQIQSPVAAGSNQQLHTPTNPCLLQSTANTSNNLFVPNSHIAPTSCILKPFEDKNSHLICTHLDKVIFSDAEKFVICSAPPSNNPMQGQGAPITCHRHLVTLFLLHRVIWVCVQRPAELSSSIRWLYKFRIFPPIWRFMCLLRLLATNKFNDLDCTRKRGWEVAKIAKGFSDFLCFHWPKIYFLDDSLHHCTLKPLGKENYFACLGNFSSPPILRIALVAGTKH